MNGVAPGSRRIRWAVGVALLLTFTAGCGVGAPVRSELASSPVDYSPEERIAEIDRLDFYIGDRMAELGIDRADASDTSAASAAPADAGPTSVPTDGAVTGTAETETGDGSSTSREPGEEPPPAYAGGVAKREKRPFDFSGLGVRDTATASRCKRVCDAAEAICIAADRICRIADSLPEHPTAGKRCSRARKDCERAKEVAASCGCHFGD